MNDTTNITFAQTTAVQAVVCDIYTEHVDMKINFIYILCRPSSHATLFSSVPEEKYLTLEGFHKFVVDRAKQDIRSVWRAILACGYDLHFER